MKSIIDYINESKKIEDPELPHNDGKTKERIAYDNNGEGWIVDAYCYADGGAPEGCNSLESLLKTYDFSGSMKEWLKEEDVDPDTFIVGAHMEDDEDEGAAWIWGYDGICYENK